MSLVLDPRHTGFAPLDFEQFFGNRNPVVLEIGSGKGRFLVTSATEDPDRNYLGIEKSLHYHRVIHDRIARRGITNVRLVNHDAFVVLQKMIGDATLAEVHIYFPDPWPRPKEQKRRIIRPDALAEMRRALIPGGLGVFVTDHRAYFEKAAPLIEQFFPEAERRIPGPHDPPRTNYEAKYREEGRAIYEVRFANRKD
ncbi:MAG TPA: tRNA (guanosine(46)-N7)-methyltransferase TrmB [Thermoanaerobaculia bacterium]|nr:tRNA (guanosine(46)-N7)-methyltransferase TrmB [Thermoanaerobaculia bacterium]